MDSAQLKVFYSKFEDWLNSHVHSDRIYILIAGWIIIYFLWYIFFEKSVLEKINNLEASIVSQQKALKTFENEIVAISAKSKALSLQKKQDEINNNAASHDKLPLASKKDNDIIIQTILTPKDDIHLISLDTSSTLEANKPPERDIVAITFTSTYFATMNYLAELEKLPWCLSWDSLEYKVAKYPDAQVVINLHIVNS
jgi:hypothetical protein